MTRPKTTLVGGAVPYGAASAAARGKTGGRLSATVRDVGMAPR